MDGPDDNNPYFDLREMALNARAEDFGVELSEDRVQVFGVVIDIVTEGGSATFMGFRTGDASMYTSRGGGFIGGIGHERVRNAAIALVEKAQARINDLTPTTDTPLPAPGQVRFYALTDKGKYFAEETVDDLFSGAGKLADLSAATNDLFTELRLIDENLQQENQ